MIPVRKHVILRTGGADDELPELQRLGTRYRQFLFRVWDVPQTHLGRVVGTQPAVSFLRCSAPTRFEVLRFLWGRKPDRTGNGCSRGSKASPRGARLSPRPTHRDWNRTRSKGPATSASPSAWRFAVADHDHNGAFSDREGPAGEPASGAKTADRPGEPGRQWS